MKKYFELERKLQRKFLMLYNNENILKILLLLFLFFIFVLLGVICCYFVGSNLITLIVAIGLIGLMLFLDVKEKKIMTSLTGFLLFGTLWVGFISASICVWLEKFIEFNINLDYIFLTIIMSILWSAYSSFCKIKMSILGNAILTGSIGIIIKSLNMQYIMDFLSTICDTNNIGQYVSGLKIVLDSMLIVLGFSTMICAIKKYWIDKYHKAEGDIMEFEE